MVTLIEVLISISLLSLVLFALLSSYSQLKITDQAIEKEVQQGFEIRHLESQLQSILIQTLKIKEKESFFYTDYPSFSSSPSLIFSYDARALLDPKFSSTVLGRLFIDTQGNLTLATWPSPKRCKEHPIPMRTLVLAKGIQSMSFSFFVPPSHELGGTIPEPNKWHSEWKISYGKVPPLMKIQIVKNSLERIDFSFYLANNQYPLKL